MKSVYEILREKENTAQRIRSEIDALRLLVPLLVAGKKDAGSGSSEDPNLCTESMAEKVYQQIEAVRVAGPLLVDEREDLASKIRAMRVEALENDRKSTRVINSLFAIGSAECFRRLSYAIRAKFRRPESTPRE